MLTHPGGRVDERNTLFLGPGMQASAEATGEAVQVGLIERFVRAGQCPPPGAKAIALLTEREIAVERDAVNAVG